MRNYIILNNQNSNTISGLIIQELPAISKPAQRTQIETIDGRDGDIVTPLGYAAYDKTFTIGLYGNFDINEVIAYFATKGTVIFSNEPDKYYYYQIVDQIDYERLVRYRVATVTMHVQPFKYSATEGTITVDASDTVSGEGSDIALDGTAEAPFNTLRHKGNATQDGTPTPDNPIEIKVLTGDSTVKITGKNLLNLDDAFNRVYPSSLTYTQTPNSVDITANTTTGAQYTRYHIDLDASKTYTLSGKAKKIVKGTDGAPRLVVRWRGSNDNGTTWSGYTTIYENANPTQGDEYNFSGTISGYSLYEVYFYNNSNTPVSLGERSQYNNIQLELGSTATDYEPYQGQSYVIPFGDTYLAKIGDYADEPVKVDGTWYIRRAIGKVVLDGTEAWGYNSSNNVFVASDLVDYMRTGFVPMSDYYTGQEITGYSQLQDMHIAFLTNANSRTVVKNTNYTTANDFKAWLAAHNTTVYYQLATPTDVEITDQDLIDALDDFYNQAHAYKGHTHITAIPEGENAPAVLAVDVNEDNESTVTNAGNTTSRPIITIYGQGDIGVYINDVEVLDVALGDEGYITLDSVEMEAYKDTTANLKNRLVTGDYSKLALNAGANKIYFTGKVTKYEISKYSRWL